MRDAELTAWLAALGLESYAAAFEEAEVDFETLPDLTVADLREIGVEAVGPRRRLETAIARLRSERRATDDAPAFIGARRHLTIMFCDVVGSTALSQLYDAEQMSVMFREYYGVVSRVLERRGGYEANRLGDGSFIFFGYPHAREHAALQAVLTAREILDETGRLVSDPGGNPIRVRAGLASGMVVLNHADTKNVFGETANIAARVQALAQPGEVVIADSTRRLLRDLVALESRGEHPLKGIAQPMHVWRVLSEHEIPEVPAPGPAAEVPLVGRAAELASLAELWETARSGHGQCAYVTGDAGLGKSRLLSEFTQQVGSEGGRHRLFRCSSETVDSPFFPFLREAQGPTAASDRIDPELAAALREPEGDESLTLIRNRRESLIRGFVRRALSDASDSPLLVCFEDAHWSDPSSLEVLSRLREALTDQPVLLLISTREPDGLQGIEADRTIALSPLGDEDMMAVVAAAIGSRDADTPKHLVAEIAARADGLPFFAEELARSFAQASAGRGDAVASIADVPASLQEALQYRVDGLEVGAEVLQLAAVFGREVPMDVLTAVVPNERTRAAAVAELRAAGLLTLAPSADRAAADTLVFKHQLVLEYVYDTILRDQQAVLHGRVADVLADRPETEPQNRAYHEERAGRSQSAAHHWAEAGRRAASRSADAEAATYFRRALALIPQFTDAEASEEFEVDVLLAFLPTLFGSDGYVSATTASINRVVELTAKRSQPEQAFNALFLQWLGQVARGGVDLAHGLGLELRPLADRISTDIASLMIDRMMGSTHMWRGELAAASEALERFAELYDADRHAAELAHYGATDNYTTVQCCRICVAVLMGDVATSRVLQESTTAEAERLGRMHNLCHVLAFGGALGSALAHDWVAMTRYVDRLDELSSEHELPFWQATVSFFRGAGAAREGDPEGGRATFDHGAEWFTTHGSGFLLPSFRVMFASAAGVGANDPADLARLDASLDFGERWLRAELWRLQAGELLRGGDSAGGLALLEQSIALAREQNAQLVIERASAMLEASTRV